jgi:Omp85 superfamily domain
VCTRFLLAWSRWAGSLASIFVSMSGVALASDSEPGASPNARRDPMDFTLVPVIGGDSDIGFGGGFITSLARTSPHFEPYIWRIEAAGMITFRSRSGELEVPFFDNYVLVDLPHVLTRQLGLQARVSYTHEEGLQYFGLGNDSQIEPGLAPDSSYYRYDRTHPTIDADLEYQLGRHWELGWGFSYTRNELSVPPVGKLAEDSVSPNPDVRRLTRIEPRHGVATFHYGIGWDTRNNEVQPQRGQLHTLGVDLSPGGTESVPFKWARINLTARWYFRLVPNRWVLVTRLVGDGLIGSPPFYELARYENHAAIGGSKGIRGIPARRYYGTLKVLSNIELRYRAISFQMFDKPHSLGLVAFADVGRLWADYLRLSELDGSGLGLRLGYGGGVRLGAGKSFVLRADVAGSPDADGVSAYLSAGHAF